MVRIFDSCAETVRRTRARAAGVRAFQESARNYVHELSRVVTIAAVVSAGTVVQAVACGGSSAVVPAEVEQIAPGVYVRRGVHAVMSAANGGAIANIGFVVGTEAVAVIDTGGSACDGQRLRAAIRARTPLPIRHVINTHVHPDHIFGNAAFDEDAPQFIGHHRLPRAMAARGKHYLEANRRFMGEAALEGTRIVAPTHTVEETLDIDLGGRVLHLVAHATGHTDNDLTVFDGKSATLWTGDILFQGHLPVIDGSLKGWLKVMDELAKIPAKKVVPGHGPAVVDWPQGLEPQRRYLTALADDLRKLIAEGRSMNEAIEQAGHGERGGWHLFDEFNPRNATVGFSELEWE